MYTMGSSEFFENHSLWKNRRNWFKVFKPSRRWLLRDTSNSYPWSSSQRYLSSIHNILKWRIITVSFKLKIYFSPLKKSTVNCLFQYRSNERTVTVNVIQTTISAFVRPTGIHIICAHTACVCLCVWRPLKPDVRIQTNYDVPRGRQRSPPKAWFTL